MQRLNSRLKREIELLRDEPPPLVACYSVNDSLQHLRATLIGARETPYADGRFHVDITIPDRYPFEPPKMKFDTPIYHPNIDNSGRICLDILKMPPKGAWKPSLNISTVLTSLQLLMSSPNPDDPLMHEIATEFRYDQGKFQSTAESWTKRYAVELKHANDEEIQEPITQEVQQQKQENQIVQSNDQFHGKRDAHGRVGSPRRKALRTINELQANIQ